MYFLAAYDQTSYMQPSVKKVSKKCQKSCSVGNGSELRAVLFEKIGTKFESWKGEDQNSNTYKNWARIPMFKRTGPEYQCLKGQGRNSNV